MPNDSWSLESADPAIEQYILSLPEPTRSKVGAHLDRLRLLGNRLRPPQTRSLGEGLMELKVLGQNAQRIYFAFRPGRRILLLGIGSKNTQRRDIETARASWREMR